MEIDKTKEEEIREMYKNGCGEVKKVLERIFPNLSKTYPYYGKNNESGKIVYFTKPNCGYVIRKNGDYNDVLKTLDKIELRKGLYNKYGLRCMNFPDSKIGEDLTLKLYCDATGKNPKEIRGGRTYRDLFKFKECFPEYLKFKTGDFNKLQDYLAGIEVTELKGSFSYSFEFNGFQLHWRKL